MTAAHEAWESTTMRAHVVPLAQALLDRIGGATVTVEFTCVRAGDSMRTSAVCVAPDGETYKLPGYLEIAHEIRGHLERIHAAYVAHGRPWRAMRLAIAPEGEISLRYDDDPTGADGDRSS